MNHTHPLAVDPALEQKWNRLIGALQQTGGVVVAFSGGVDSGLLATAAHLALGSQALAVTVHSPVNPPGEVESAQALAAQVGFAHQVVDHDDLANPQFVANPPDRCYHCKRVRLGAIQEIARQRGIAVCVEGSNADDTRDYRPGRRAVVELGARSPLAEAGLTKADIRALARALGLSVADRPSAPCLATRFPYGTPVTPQGLQQVGDAEAVLKRLGFAQARVRHHGAIARIEVAPADVERLVAQRASVVPALKALGFQYVAVDLEGYRMGSMNEVLAP